MYNNNEYFIMIVTRRVRKLIEETSMSKGKSIRTAIMIRRLAESASIMTFISKHQRHFVQKTLPEFLGEKRADKNLVREQAIKRSNIDRTFGHQIFNGRKNPSRDKLLQLAFGLQLTVEETQEMLLLADKRQLHPKYVRDSVILFCLLKRMSVQNVDEYLLSRSQQPLQEEHC